MAWKSDPVTLKAHIAEAKAFLHQAETGPPAGLGDIISRPFRAPSGGPPVVIEPYPVPSGPTSDGDDYTDAVLRLMQIGHLLESGVINHDEALDLKSRVLGGS